MLSLPFTLALLGCAALAGVMAVRILVEAGVIDAPGSGQSAVSRDGATVIQLAAMQAVLIGGVLAAASWRGGSVRETLALGRPAGRAPRVYIVSYLLMVVLVSGFTFIVWLLEPSVLLDDLRPFMRLMRSEWGPLALLAVAVGAPLSEEFLFRGFLFTSLASSRVGVAGAVLLTTLAWTALHAGYSITGLIEVFLIGLFFSWLLLKTGSLWVPLVCHAVYNATIMLVLKFAPLAL